MIIEQNKEILTKQRLPKVDLEIQYGMEDSNLPYKHVIKSWVLASVSKNIKLTIRIIDELEGKKLNEMFRGKKTATNVLSFPYRDNNPIEGDIAICFPVVKREASLQRKPILAHLAHLTIHGTLHLQGFTHDDDVGAEIMEKREKFIMNELGFGNPY